MDLDPSSSISVGIVVIILISLIFSAFFSGVEIAFVSANRLKIELDKKKGNYAAGIISFLQRYPKMFIGSMLVGNNAAMVLYTYFAGNLILWLFWGVENTEHTSHPAFTLLVQTLITTVVVLFVAEFLPKAVFRSAPNKWLYLLAFPLVPILLILYLPAMFVTAISMLMLLLFKSSQKENQSQVDFGKVDLDHYLKEMTDNVEDKDILGHEIQIFQNALDFTKIKARECMIPRNEIVAFSIDDSIDDLRFCFVETGLSKILIYRDNIDNIIGYVHSYELFKKPEFIRNVLLPVSIVPEPMPVNEVLELLIKQKKNMAVVVDEFGGTSGILTMEDIVEELFGEIEDEHDSEDLVERETGPGEFVFSARLEIDYLNSKYNLNLPISDEYDTLGGLIINHCEEIPPRGTILDTDEYFIKVLTVSETRIEEVSLRQTG